MPNANVSLLSFIFSFDGWNQEMTNNALTIFVSNIVQRGSVTVDISKAVGEAKRGRVEFRMDKTAIVHVGLGKVQYYIPL